MSGRIAVYDAKARRGRIRGLDGEHYPFVRHEVLGPAPSVGELVSFDLERGVAVHVRPLEAEADYWPELARLGERMLRSISVAAHP